MSAVSLIRLTSLVWASFSTWSTTIWARTAITLGAFAADYVTDRYKTDWGQAINYDGPNSGPVREYFTANAGYWIEEYHFDGLRWTRPKIYMTARPSSILSAINRRVREAARGRSTIIVTENEPQEIKMVRPLAQGGHGFDGMWNDDFHHSAQSALTGRAEAYLSDYLGTPQEYISMAKRGFLYQGQLFRWQKKRRGTLTTGVPPHAFVVFLENHDQVANSAYGLRPEHVSNSGRHRAMTALLLLNPATPMLFQGQEFSSSHPFLFFADHKPELARLVHQGRKSSWPSSPAWLSRRSRNESPIPRRRPHSNVANWIFQNGRNMRQLMLCTGISCACVARIRCSRPSAPAGWMEPF